MALKNSYIMFGGVCAHTVGGVGFGMGAGVLSTHTQRERDRRVTHFIENSYI